MKSAARRQRLIIAGVAYVVFLSINACRGPAQKTGQDKLATAAASSTMTSPFEVVAPLLQKQSKFDHHRREHGNLLCGQCHRRDERDPVNPVPDHPYHDACAKCHARENFLEVSSNSPLCAVCHGQGRIMTAEERARVTEFPKSLNQFGLKRFSHQTHLDPNKMPAGTPLPKCGSCHRFDHRMIAASFPRHQECYSCHAHSAGQNLSACGDCHADLDSAMRLDKGLGAATHQYNFKHSTHLKQDSIKSNCVVCHRITERPADQLNGAGGSDIVRGVVARGQRHQSACWNCHVQSREPVCAKCHLNGFPSQ